MSRPTGSSAQNGLREDLGAMALFLAEGDVAASAHEAMQMPYAEALTMTARLSRRNEERRRQMEERRRKLK